MQTSEGKQEQEFDPVKDQFELDKLLELSEADRYLLSFASVDDMKPEDIALYNEKLDKESKVKHKQEKIKEEELAGWDNFKVISIDKYEDEAVVITTKGTMKASMREIFVQYNFRMKVFETFAINLQKVKETVYNEWLNKWTEKVNDMGMEYGTSMERLQEALELYLSPAEEKDLAYLRNGSPIVLPDGDIAFKSLEFTLWTKKNYNMAHTENQVRAKLKELGCKPRQLGSTRIRAWSYSMPRIEQEGQVEIKFEKNEATGKAPEVMAEEELPAEELF